LEEAGEVEKRLVEKKVQYDKLKARGSKEKI